MFGRGWFAVLLAGAMGLPYLASHFGLTSPATKTDVEQIGKQLPVKAAPDALDGQYEIGQSQVLGEPSPFEITPISEVLRFDRNVPWVLGRWSRVSTSLASLDLQGYRVSLVTGTSPGDMAGSLTYYFSRDQTLSRIAFNGTTGDAQPLVHWLESQHAFKRVVSDDPRLFLYQVARFGRVISELRVKPARVVLADAPNARFEVTLVMRNPRM